MLCRLCLDAAPAGAVKIIKLYDDGAVLAVSAPRPQHVHYRDGKLMNENFSLIVMCLFLLGSLAFLAQQLTSYH